MLGKLNLLNALLIRSAILLDHEGMSLNGDGLAELVILWDGVSVFRNVCLGLHLDVWGRSD